ncbi:phage tail protein [Enterobacter sp. ECC-175]|uniref:phage tail protein n=1 Tax=unclassified Enterobacter TaxID=2608935 RepID=UPI000D43E146|nr:phage tail protein [Enterobacter sp. RIT 418]RAU29886.1 phage tail protein [Enterobacter sp. RIT 418]
MKSPFEPETNHRFLAFFMFQGIPDVLSIRFQRISGLSREIQTQRIREGGNNVANQFIPRGVSYPNLIFERGVMTVSPLTVAFDFVMSGFQTGALPINVDILLLNELNIPVASWYATGLMPVRMSIGDFDASSGGILMNRMEVACERVEWLGVKL